MAVSGVTTGDPITEAWGDSVASSVTALEGVNAGPRLAALEAVTPYVPGGTDVPITDGGTGASTAAAARTNLGIGTAQSPAFAGVAVPAVVFPATDVPVADVHTLDDYEEGTWTPVLAFATPGTSSWAPTVQTARYTKIGNRVLFDGVYTGVPTNGSASGNLNLTGFPFTAGQTTEFQVSLQGYTKAGYTQVSGRLTGTSTAAAFDANGSGVAGAILAVGDIPSLGTVTARFSGSYAV